MSPVVSPTRRTNPAQSGGAALNILILVAGSVLILGLVVCLQKSGLLDRASAPEPERLEPSAARQKARGDERPKPVVEPTVQPKTPVDNGTTATVSTPVAPAVVGDAEWKRYHRGDCKYVEAIREDKKIPFASAAEAFDRGYIPCKVCNPDALARAVGLTEGKQEESKAVSTRLVGEAGRRRYHRADCEYAKSIPGDRKVLFRSPADAFARGYLPCRTCNPDLPELLAEAPLPERPVQSGALTEKDKHDMYKSLFALKGMLKGISTRERPYEVLSDRYRIPVSAVEAVEAEGNGKRWPQQ